MRAVRTCSSDVVYQEDAGAAQDAATAQARLESELQQAKGREEQLRNSRAQCEYQLQQAGVVAQSQVRAASPIPTPSFKFTARLHASSLNACYCPPAHQHLFEHSWSLTLVCAM